MNKKILVADDEPAVLALMLDVFKEAGLQADGASGGREAFDRLSQGGYSLLVTDIHMPDMNGIELIRKTHALFPRLEAIALSGYGTLATREKLDSLGIFGYMDKPMPPDALVSLARNALKSDRLFRLQKLGGPSVTCYNRCRVLVVDDNPSILRMMGDFLQEHQCSVKTAGNGAQALEEILVSEYDLIVLDVNMPVMNGVEAVRAIREHDPYTYILLVSGEADSLEIRKAMELGANRFLPKPFDMQALLSVVDKIDAKRIAESKRAFSANEHKKQLNARPWRMKLFDYFRLKRFFRKMFWLLVIMAVCFSLGYLISEMAKADPEREEAVPLPGKQDRMMEMMKEMNRLQK